MSEQDNGSGCILVGFALFIIVGCIGAIANFEENRPRSLNLSQEEKELADLIVNQFQQEISIARYQGLLSQQQSKVDFLTQVVALGGKMLGNPGNGKIVIGATSYTRQEVTTDLEFRQKHLESAEQEVDALQRTIGVMNDNLSNFQDLTNFKASSINSTNNSPSQLVALHQINNWPPPKPSRSDWLSQLIEDARSEFDDRLELLRNSAEPDLDYIMVFPDQSPVSNFHWQQAIAAEHAYYRGSHSTTGGSVTFGRGSD